jgi:hypothetical protein
MEVPMHKPITRAQHGIADYLYVPTVAAAPSLWRFADDRTPARLARTFSAATLVMTLFTRAEWGAVKVIPYNAHLALDVGSGVLALAAPWLFGFAQDRAARNTFLGMGIAALVIAGLLSRPEG